MKKLLLGFVILSSIVLMTGCGEDAASSKEAEVVLDIGNATEEKAPEEVQEVKEDELKEDAESTLEPSRFHSDFADIVQEGASRGIAFSAEKKEMALDKDGFIYFTARYAVPSIEIGSNTTASAVINNYLADSTASYETNIELLRAEAESLLVPGPGNEPVRYEVSSELVPTRLDGQVISFRGMASEYLGGAHGANGYTGYNFDAKTGNLLTLASIANDTNAFKTSAREYIVKACDNMKDDTMFFDSYEDCIDAMISEGAWYMTNDGVVFIAGEYLLAPFSEGIIEVLVPYENLESVNPAYLP